MVKERWKIWDNDKAYGKVFYKRAIGKLSEMESSRAAAKIVARIIKANDKILDVGCGSGHYLVSLDNNVNVPFSYHGIDPTAYYIKMAKKAFLEKFNHNPLRKECKFQVGDVFNLDLANNYADLVMCNNVLLHLPSIKKPIRELWRVTRKYLLIRTLIGKNSFRIKQVNQPEEYGADGEPHNFHFFNIYSTDYMVRLINELKGVKRWRLIDDKDYDPKNIGAANYKNAKKPHDLTIVVSGMQINNYIVQPWKFLIIEK